MVLSLLVPHQDRVNQDQETFKMLRDHNYRVDKQLEALNKTVFEDGAGVQIFDVIKNDIENIRKAISNLDDQMEKRLQQIESKINEINHKQSRADEYAEVSRI
jgi:hypothetical protein